MTGVEKKYVVSSSSQNASITDEEMFMNFNTMVEKTREGKHARRHAWKEGEKLWSDGKILIHNTPYFGEPLNQAIQGYSYVCEQVDVVADDWELVSAC